LMLPSTGSTKNIHAHAVSLSAAHGVDKTPHAKALLTRYGLTTEHSMSDVLDEIEATESPLLMPIR
jgi:hypothetical protein